MLRVFFQDISLRDCLQHLIERDLLLSHFLLSMLGHAYVIGARLHSYYIQHTSYPSVVPLDSIDPTVFPVGAMRDSGLPIALSLCARLPLTEVHHVADCAGTAKAVIKIFGPAESAGAGA
jgi:hypothetical protein